MTKETIIRAWKDAEFRNSLTASELSLLPPSPAGVVALDEVDLGQVGGAGPTWYVVVFSLGCCDGLTGSQACPSGNQSCGPTNTAADGSTCGFSCK
jgi:mersacidin/lichenicidin family type 2 lantibiotic